MYKRNPKKCLIVSRLYVVMLTLWGLLACLPVASARSVPHPTTNQSPELRCTLSYASEETHVTIHPTDRVYEAPLVKVLNRFLFKGILAMDNGMIDYVKLYVYYPDDERVIPIQEIIYKHPRMSTGNAPISLTGEQHVYSPALGRELIYGCALVESEHE